MQGGLNDAPIKSPLASGKWDDEEQSEWTTSENQPSGKGTGLKHGAWRTVRVLYQRQLLGTLMTNSVPKATENIRITFNSQVLRIVRERGPTYDIYLYQTYRGRNVTDQYSNGKPDLWLPDYQIIPSLIKH
ncbi:hypothetical protein quinque_003264 [Culex quinquefasciatus]